MKPIVVFISVLIALGLAIQPLAAGQQATQTQELSLSAEQWSEEIAAWQEQLAELEKNLANPKKIWVLFRSGETMAVDIVELVRFLREHKILEMIRRAEDSQRVGFRDLRLEDKSIFRTEVEASVEEAYTELVKQDRAIRAIKEQQARRLREIIRGLEKKRADVLAAQSQAAGTPTFQPDEATVSASDIAAVKDALEPVRLREQWDLRDHGYVLSYLDRKVKTPSQLRLVKKLIADISACYQAWLAEKARIAEAARAGNWMPGKRIEAGDQGALRQGGPPEGDQGLVRGGLADALGALAAVDEVADAAHPRHLFLASAARRRGAVRFSRICSTVFGPRHADVDRGMGEDEAVAVGGRRRLLARRHLLGFEELAPAGGGESHESRAPLLPARRGRCPAPPRGGRRCSGSGRRRKPRPRPAPRRACGCGSRARWRGRALSLSSRRAPSTSRRGGSLREIAQDEDVGVVEPGAPAGRA